MPAASARTQARELAERVLAGDRAALSSALNLIDDSRPERRAEALALLDQVAGTQAASKAKRIGVTGAPGAGKSSLLDALLRHVRSLQLTVGVIAVDPSSRISGGALLGDRFRMRSGSQDEGVFVRSMAARSRLGGLADATHASVALLSAVFDVVCVETVGVGQSETEVAQLVDTLVFVAQPGAGDMLQFMKAGLVELPHIFAVNKADVGPQAERTARELGAGLGLAEPRSDGWKPPVLLVSAREGRGIGELWRSIEAHRAHLEASGALAERRRSGELAFLRDALLTRYGSFGLEQIGGEVALTKHMAGSSGASFGLVTELSQQIEAALCRKPK